LYAAVSFCLLAVAYAGIGPRMLLKQADGRRRLIGWVLFAPYFLLTAVTFGLHRLLSREAPYVEATRNLYFGRRLSTVELTAAGWPSVLDLAGEFTASRSARELPRYRSLPVLDATAPTEAELHSAVAWIAKGVASGSVYVHCALGHGRSACVVIAYLLEQRTVADVADGERLLQSLRPSVRLRRTQFEALERFATSLPRYTADPATRSEGTFYERP
jgi:hypothetical protein